MTTKQLEQLSINTIRTLSMDAVQEAKSGHPGTPMALAPLIYTLWNRVMRFDPQNPIWPNRDRFVLSNVHASMLLWSALHLTRTQAVNADYEVVRKPSVSLDDIRRFRQLAQKWLANRYNQPGFDVFDYDIYSVCGDGDMMEADSVAGFFSLALVAG